MACNNAQAHANRQTDRQADRQTDRNTGHTQTHTHTHSHTHTHTHTHSQAQAHARTSTSTQRRHRRTSCAAVLDQGDAHSAGFANAERFGRRGGRQARRRPTGRLVRRRLVASRQGSIRSRETGAGVVGAIAKPRAQKVASLAPRNHELVKQRLELSLAVSPPKEVSGAKTRRYFIGEGDGVLPPDHHASPKTKTKTKKIHNNQNHPLPSADLRRDQGMAWWQCR